jgi:hypothetical protein
VITPAEHIESGASACDGYYSRALDGESIRLHLLVKQSYQGGTLLALLLNNHSQLAALGSTFPPRQQDSSCSCGATIFKCPFWTEINRRVDTTKCASESLYLSLIPRLIADPRWNERLNSGLAWLAARIGPVAWRLFEGERASYLRAHVSFYDAVCALTGADSIVVTLETLSHIRALRSMLGNRLRLGIVHLVRDPRGYATSIRKYHPSIDAVAAVRSQWKGFNVALENLVENSGDTKLLRVRYEDLCDHPQSVLGEIEEFFEIAREQIVGPPRYAHKNHATGNKMKNTFDGTIIKDESWKQLLIPEVQAGVIEAAEPIFSRYGYHR